MQRTIRRGRLGRSGRPKGLQGDFMPSSRESDRRPVVEQRAEQQEILDEQQRISSSSVNRILIEHLHILRSAARWVPKSLSTGTHQTRVTIRRRLPEMYVLCLSRVAATRGNDER